MFVGGSVKDDEWLMSTDHVRDLRAIPDVAHYRDEIQVRN